MSGPGEALRRAAEGDTFVFALPSGRAVIEDFEPGRDVIDLSGLGLTPHDLLPYVRGGDLVLSFDGGEVVLRGLAGTVLREWDYRW